MEAEDDRVEGSQAEEMEGQEEYASEAHSASQGAEAEYDIFKNNHDLIGV